MTTLASPETDYTDMIPDTFPSLDTVQRHLDKTHNAEPDGLAWKWAVKLRVTRARYHHKRDDTAYRLVATDLRYPAMQWANHVVLNKACYGTTSPAATPMTAKSGADLVRMERQARIGPAWKDGISDMAASLVRYARLVVCGTPADLGPEYQDGKVQPMDARVYEAQYALQGQYRSSPLDTANLLVMSPGDFAELMAVLRRRAVPMIPDGSHRFTIDPPLRLYYRAATGNEGVFIEYNGDIATCSSMVKPGRVVLCGPGVPNRIDPSEPSHDH